MIPTDVHVVECPRCGFDLRSDPLPPEPEPSPDRAVLGGDGSPPPDRRWLRAFVDACREAERYGSPRVWEDEP